MEAPGE